ncbi:MAG TPA: hypothetical protein ENH94_06275 [Phycisphaerales bacterium]|nr:hypothetical protein [Phycisphaerales bacterium]
MLHSLNSEEHAEEDTETRLKVVEEFATVYNAIAASYLRYIGKPPQSLYKDDREYCMAVVKEIRDKINTGGVCSYIADMEKLIAERRSMCDTVIVKEISRAESAEYRNRN